MIITGSNAFCNYSAEKKTNLDWKVKSVSNVNIFKKKGGDFIISDPNDCVSFYFGELLCTASQHFSWS